MDDKEKPETMTHEIRPPGVTTVHEDGTATYEKHPFEEDAPKTQEPHEEELK